MKRRYDQLDVFSAVVLKGNPLAVVHAAEGLPDATMAAFARWTNLSETTFLLPPTDPAADYRVRIWTPGGELPFAGHPTLGSCHAWLAAGGRPQEAGMVVQQCGVGLVRIRRRDGRLAFAAPPLRRRGPLGAVLRARIAAGLGVAETDLLHDQWVDNGPGWCAVMLRDAAQVLAVVPDRERLADLKLGLVGAQAPGQETRFEVRAFVPLLGVAEDPVTGSLNAGLAQWLIGAGLAPPRYVAAQGAALGRAGRVHVEQDGAEIWIGGDVAECIRGEVEIG
ncbi:MAG: PhzF family phenazine biosynthesis protein [Burkholderiales bacterium]|nr:PhzF family phenazine biosynthesis protein [Burkholderiales bacterium]MDE2160941.1 PhzF family phenazine biosynthesis protein [Burkholderiales bacterium]